MSDTTREQLLVLALGVLPAPPGSIEVISEDGGCFPIRISHRDGDVLHAYIPRTSARINLHLLARVHDPERGSYEVEFKVVDAFYHSGQEALVHAAICAVRRRKARRTAPRVALSEPATVRVVYCRSMPRDAQFEVRLSDASTTGMAFISQRELHPGDLLVLGTAIDHTPMQIEMRVIRSDPAPYGRYRCGCEITELSDPARRAITNITAGADAGSVDQRSGEPADPPRRAAEPAALSARIRPAPMQHG